MSELEELFFAEEAEAVRGLLLGELERRVDGRAEFNFNTVDVLMDFDAQAVTLSHFLVSGGQVTLPLADFRARLEGL
jgi:hypothetical protein